MMSLSRNHILNLLAVAVFGLFLWWAEGHLSGYQSSEDYKLNSYKYNISFRP